MCLLNLPKSFLDCDFTKHSSSQSSLGSGAQRPATCCSPDMHLPEGVPAPPFFQHPSTSNIIHPSQSCHFVLGTQYWAATETQLGWCPECKVIYVQTDGLLLIQEPGELMEGGHRLLLGEASIQKPGRCGAGSPCPFTASLPRPHSDTAGQL